MKTTLILLLTACCASAIELKDLVGSWTGTRKQTENGVGFSNKVKIDGRFRADGGVILTEKGSSPIRGAYTARHNFFKGGKFSSVYTSSQGLIFISVSGKWTRTNKAIAITGKNSNFGGTAKLSGKVELRGSNRIYYSATVGNSKVVITGNKL